MTNATTNTTLNWTTVPRDADGGHYRKFTSYMRYGKEVLLERVHQVNPNAVELRTKADIVHAIIAAEIDEELAAEEATRAAEMAIVYEHTALCESVDTLSVEHLAALANVPTSDCDECASLLYLGHYVKLGVHIHDEHNPLSGLAFMTPGQEPVIVKVERYEPLTGRTLYTTGIVSGGAYMDAGGGGTWEAELAGQHRDTLRIKTRANGWREYPVAQSWPCDFGDWFFVKSGQQPPKAVRERRVVVASLEAPTEYITADTIANLTDGQVKALRAASFFIKDGYLGWGDPCGATWVAGMNDRRQLYCFTDDGAPFCNRHIRELVNGQCFACIKEGKALVIIVEYAPKPATVQMETTAAIARRLEAEDGQERCRYNYCGLGECGATRLAHENKKNRRDFSHDFAGA